MSKKTLASTLASTLDPAMLDPTASSNLAVILNELNDKPTLMLSEETIETLAANGVSVHNVCKMFRKSFSYLNENPNLLAAFDKGRSTLGARMRTTLVDAAIEDRNIQSAIYLDKILSGDQVASEVNVNVTASQLSSVSDEDLLKVAFNVDDTIEDNFSSESAATGSAQ